MFRLQTTICYQISSDNTIFNLSFIELSDLSLCFSHDRLSIFMPKFNQHESFCNCKCQMLVFLPVVVVIDSWSVTVSVSVRVDGGAEQMWYSGDVVYRNEREQPVFDMAVISLRGYSAEHLQEIEIAECYNEGKNLIYI